MNKLTISLLKLACFAGLFMSASLLVSGQNSHEKIKVLPKWKVGDFRNIHIETSKRTLIGDSLVDNHQTKYDALFKVVEITDHILIRWTCNNDQDFIRFKSPWTTPNKVQTQLNVSLEAVKTKVLTSEMILKLNKDTGKAEEWMDGLKKIKNAEYQEKKNLRDWCKMNEISAENRVDMELTFSKILMEDYEKWRRILLNKVSMLFEQYDKAFDLSEATTETIYTTDLLTDTNQDIDFPALCTRSAKEMNNRLTLKNDIQYDKKFLILYLQKTQDYLHDLTLDNVMIVEKEQAVFDLTNTWIVSYTKSLSFEVKELRTFSQTNITYK